MPVWRTLSHNGVVFPDQFVPRGTSIRVSGQEVKLSPLAEEMAYQFAKKKDTPYVQDPVFVANFMKYFVKQLPPTVSKQAKFQDFDFSQFYRIVDEEKRDKETMTKEAKKSLAASRKEKREALRARYGKAVLDGKEIELANYMVEPPGLFMGRGAHPLRGSWKPRVTASEVTLNLDKGAPVPPGGFKVAHDDESIWIARWMDKLTEKEKYVWPHESSDIQQSRNVEKYDKALKVGQKLPTLQKRLREKMGDRDEKARKLATVCFLIDEVGMRVGDEKDEDEADTVGATTLRVEHVKRLDDQAIEFDFLGKDSVRWLKTLKSPDPALVKNMREFMAPKEARQGDLRRRHLQPRQHLPLQPRPQPHSQRQGLQDLPRDQDGRGGTGVQGREERLRPRQALLRQGGEPRGCKVLQPQAHAPQDLGGVAKEEGAEARGLQGQGEGGDGAEDAEGHRVDKGDQGVQPQHLHEELHRPSGLQGMVRLRGTGLEQALLKVPPAQVLLGRPVKEGLAGGKGQLSGAGSGR